jgi:very-short-patch-repair endonuclease
MALQPKISLIHVDPSQLENPRRRYTDVERTLVRRVALARQHRNHPTIAEQRLWQVLRRRQVDGFGFRRQFPIGPYFADFFCPAARLAIELDGGSHVGRERKDRLRDTFFRRRAIIVLRIPNLVVLHQPDLVIDLIKDALRPGSPLTQ